MVAVIGRCLTKVHFGIHQVFVALMRPPIFSGPAKVEEHRLLGIAINRQPRQRIRVMSPNHNRLLPHLGNRTKQGGNKQQVHL